jgi:DNA-binding transcriptional ArsR family regulator
VDRTVAAIADPVRRAILVLLRDQALTAGQIAEQFPISRPAVSRHLRVLRESNLVADTALGRTRIYQATPAPLAEVAAWITAFERLEAWTERLAALDTEVHRSARDRRSSRLPRHTQANDEEIA